MARTPHRARTASAAVLLPVVMLPLGCVAPRAGVVPLAAVEPPAGTAPRATQEAGREPLVVDVDADDWLQTTSGEWLNGELIVMADDEVTFDGEELDEVQVDWADVRSLITTRRLTVITNDLETFVGVVSVQGDEVAPGWRGRPRRAPARRRVPDPARAGVVARVLARHGLARPHGARRQLGTARRHRTGAAHPADAAHAARGLPRPVPEHPPPEHELHGVRRLRRRRHPVGGRRRPGLPVPGGLLGARRRRHDREGAIFVLDTFVDHELTQRIDPIFEYRIDVGLEDLEDTNQTLHLGLSVDLLRDLDLDVDLYWDRTGEPSPDANGAVPEEDDLRLVVGVEFEFRAAR